MLSSGSVAKGSASASKLPKYSSTRPLDRSRRPWFISLLVAVKVCSSLAIFMLAEFLQNVTHSQVGGGHHSGSNNKGHATESSRPFLSDSKKDGHGEGLLLGRWGPIFQTLAFIQFVSGLNYVFVQKPLSKGPVITPNQWFRISRHSAILILYWLTWICGLVLTGPLRTVFLSLHYDYTLAGIASGFFVSKSGPRLRGGVLFVAGIMVLLLFDDISSNPVSKNGEDQQQTHTYLSKNSVGILTFIVFLIFKLSFDALSNRLAVDVGGIKRLQSLSTMVSGIILWILVLFDYCTGGSMISIWSNFFTLIFIVLFGFVLNYYVDSICMKRMDQWQVARIGTSASHFSAFIYSLLWITMDEVPNIATIISFALIYNGAWSLTTSERASGGGTLIGFSGDGLPLFNFSSHFSGGDGRTPLWKNLLRLAFSFYKQILEDRMSRRIFYYFIITLSFTSVEFLYGAISNSLGLISDGFHMLFDSIAISIGLFASVMSRWKPNPTFPFGYGRIEVLSGFLNAFFLLVVAGAIFIEAWARLFSPPTIDAHQTLTISVIGLVVNLIGIYIFRNGGGSGHNNTHVHDNANIRGVFLHVLADTMSSIGVIVSSLLIKHVGLLIADPICSLVIATLIATTAWPLLKDTGRILLLSVPSGLERKLQQVVLQLLAAEGVKGYSLLRFWTHAPQILTGSIHIQATMDANEQQIIRHVNNLFASIGFSHFSTQVEKDEFVARRNFNGDEDDPALLTNKSLTGIDIVGIGRDSVINNPPPVEIHNTVTTTVSDTKDIIMVPS